MVGTRWVDARRGVAEEQSKLAAELRVHLAEAHRCGNACVRALRQVMEARNNQWLYELDADKSDGTLLDAINNFESTLETLRAQGSELLVRSDPSAQRGATELITNALDSGERLSRWLRSGILPEGWELDDGEDHMSDFLTAESSAIETMPRLLIQVGAPDASPAALGPWLASIRRRNSRRERQELRRQRLSTLAGRLTGRYRRELREAEERRNATLAEAEQRRRESSQSCTHHKPPLATESIPNALSDSTMFYDACILAARVETNVPQGGDAGHGGRTRLRLRDEGSFAFGDIPGGQVSDDTIEIEVLGDAEASVLAESLLWAGERLQAMINMPRKSADMRSDHDTPSHEPSPPID
jgi:bacterioferritin-associated ferredoxin